jgi:hypothetical protein
MTDHTDALSQRSPDNLRARTTADDQAVSGYVRSAERMRRSRAASRVRHNCNDRD